MGPLHFITAAADLLAWAHYFFRTRCQYSRVGLLPSLLLLTIYSLGPIISSGHSADTLGWAYCLHCCCWQFTCLGPLFLQGALPMLLAGPIFFHYCCWQFTRLGPLFLRDALPILSGGPIAFTAAAADLLAWDHYFFGERCRCSRLCPFPFTTAAADLLAWAHYFFGTRCWFTRLGPLFLQGVLLMPLDELTVFTAAVVDLLARAHSWCFQCLRVWKLNLQR